MCLNHCNISVIDYSKMVSSLNIQKVIVKLFWQRKLIGQNIYTSENCIKQNTSKCTHTLTVKKMLRTVLLRGSHKHFSKYCMNSTH